MLAHTKGHLPLSKPYITSPLSSIMRFLLLGWEDYFLFILYLKNNLIFFKWTNNLIFLKWTKNLIYKKLLILIFFYVYSLLYFGLFLKSKKINIYLNLIKKILNND